MTEDRSPIGDVQMPSLVEAIDRLADELDDIHRHASGQAVEYVRGTTVFAAREGNRVSFRLRPELAGAALNTPDTAQSARGPEWVALLPSRVDGFAIDRGLAWFESAWRYAGEQLTPPQASSRPN
jgi:hypothetical protein